MHICNYNINVYICVFMYVYMSVYVYTHKHTLEKSASAWISKERIVYKVSC